MQRIRTGYTKNKIPQGLALLFFLILGFRFISCLLSKNFTGLIFDILLFLLVFILFIFFFSQFIFPISGNNQRWLVFKNILNFITHRHGPIYAIREGKQNLIKSADKKNRPGIIITESDSAAVLRKSAHFTRAIGPGITFTEKDESIADSVDIRIQQRWFGPYEDENPFSPRKKFESQSHFNARKKRGDFTRGLTRDGIDIIPSFDITFKIKSNPGNGKTPYGYDSLAVERAIIGKSINQSNVINESPAADWESVAIMLTVNAWRELLHIYKLNELFQTEKNAIELIITNIQDRLTKSEIRSINQNDNQSDQFILSEEYKILAARGIIVTNLHLAQLWIPPEIETQVVNNWKSAWLDLSQNEKESVEKLQREITNQSKDLASSNLATEISEAALNNSNQTNKTKMMHSLLNICYSKTKENPKLQNLITKEIQKLGRLNH